MTEDWHYIERVVAEKFGHAAYKSRMDRVVAEIAWLGFVRDIDPEYEFGHAWYRETFGRRCAQIVSRITRPRMN